MIPEFCTEWWLIDFGNSLWPLVFEDNGNQFSTPQQILVQFKQLSVYLIINSLYSGLSLPCFPKICCLSRQFYILHYNELSCSTCKIINLDTEHFDNFARRKRCQSLILFNIIIVTAIILLFLLFPLFYFSCLLVQLHFFFYSARLEKLIHWAFVLIPSFLH